MVTPIPSISVRIDLPELDIAPRHGLTMKGWDYSQAEVARALADGLILNPAMELFSNRCPWNCSYCFTESTAGTKKRKLSSELSLQQRMDVLGDLARLGARAINIVGAGEPTIDSDFFALLECAAKLDMTPIVYTEGSLRLSDLDFCRKLYDLGATLVLKVNSLWQEEYQNQILVSGDPGRKTPRYNYFKARQKAIENLFALGFNKENPTRLAFDTIICRENVHEMVRLHRFARDHNIFVLMVNYLPSGRSASGHTNAISKAEQLSVFGEMARIDENEYGIVQRGIFPYAGAQPCLIRGTGLFVKINGDVLACPGETEAVGNVLTSPLAEIWNRLVDVRASFDGGCAPRERYWAALENDEYLQSGSIDNEGVAAL